MKQRYPMADDMASLTFLLSWTADAAGKTYHAIVPLEGQTLDGRGDAAALFATLEDLRLFAPDGVRLQLLNCDIAPDSGALADGISPPQPQSDVRYTLQFLISFSAAIEAKTDALLAAFGKMLATGIAAPAAWPEVGTNESELSLKTAGGAPVAAKWVEVPASGVFDTTTISGEETIVGLAENGAAVFIVVNHSADAEFAFCEYPRTNAPAGVLVRVVASRENGDDTTGAQFVLEIENVSYGGGYDYGGSPPDIVIGWTRTGVLV
jgi:hypothetical protein